jgi:hypothetical protein
MQSDVAAGEELAEDNLNPIPIPGNREALRKSFISWQDRAILFGTQAHRDYRAGDVVFHRDIQPPSKTLQWDVIGPFKLIGVGERFTERSGDELDDARTDGNNLTIAVDANFDERTRRLLEVIRTDGNADQGRPAIVAVQVLPSSQNERFQQDEVSENIVYQTVSLDGIANVPRVLLEGDMIRFVIPAGPRY